MFQFLKFDSTTIFLVKALGVVSWPTFAVFPDDVMMMMMFLCPCEEWRSVYLDYRLLTISTLSHLYLPHAHPLILGTHAWNLTIRQNPQIHKVFTSSEMSLIMNLIGALLLLRMSLPNESNCFYTCRFPLTLTTLFLDESIFSQINSSVTYTVFGD